MSRTTSTRRRPLAPIRLVALAVLAAGLIGCQPSPWESEFRAAGGARPIAARATDAPLRVREVPWERLQQTLGALEQERIASDTHPDDWSPQQKAAAKAALLRGLQISEDPEQIEILGRSDFLTTQRVRPDDQLEAFARKIGATTVVWSTSYAGKTDVVRSEPVTEWRSGSWSPAFDRDSHSRSFSENSTIWVPVVVQADQRAFTAFFLRESPEALAARMVR